MIIKRNHPHYKVKIDPKDKTIYGKEFGDVPFTQTEFEFNYSDEVEVEDIPNALVNVFAVDREVVMEAWERGE